MAALEKLTGNNSASNTHIQWNDDLENDFNQAKEKLKELQEVFTPRPSDKLVTYSDYSQEHKAIGGQLIIHRENDGKTEKLNGGFFSARLTRFHTNWLPCEGEALGIKLVLEHFAPFIRESTSKTHHYTDSLPCVHAFRRSKKGAQHS